MSQTIVITILLIASIFIVPKTLLGLLYIITDRTNEGKEFFIGMGRILIIFIAWFGLIFLIAFIKSLL